MDGKVLALFSAMLFGINPIVLKVGLRDAASEVAVFIGLLSGLPLLLLLGPFLGGFHLAELRWDAGIYFALGGLLGVVFGRTLLYMSIDRIGSSRAATFKNSAPLVTALVAFLLLQEIVDAQRAGGIFLVTLGLTLIGQMARRQTGIITASGLILAMMTAFFYGVRPVISKVGLEISPLPLAATLISYVTAVAVYAGYFLYRHQLRELFRVGSRKSYAAFAGGGLLQVAGLSLLNFALDLDDVTVIYPISASAPLVTFLLSYLVLRNMERLTVWDLLGTTMVVSGVIMLLV
ncbi:MAG TPA: EamA family transporter [Candidatus Binatia bacterium]|nr:EamA family transporter [Candidatus Binatia bacterium]